MEVKKAALFKARRITSKHASRSEKCIHIIL